ncbi:hypothetical protein CFP56_001972 [Quercus suber]|uniref:Uncharacterized protein n=1 Tax=Quercus suber TaxID=58331 RepID=A0AAW0LHM8_QUESU
MGSARFTGGGFGKVHRSTMAKLVELYSTHLYSLDTVVESHVRYPVTNYLAMVMNMIHEKKIAHFSFMSLFKPTNRPTMTVYNVNKTSRHAES